MKLRNKKTGEIATKIDVSQDGESFWVLSNKPCMYKTLAELNEDWEDYKPDEPLIKDEKIRKAVRAWWETIPDAIGDKRIAYKKNQDLAVGIYTIFCGVTYPETLEVGKMYTIEELCGEEE